MRIRAISLDLDDTLWPILPVMQRVERCVDAWLREQCPQVAERWPIESLRNLRDQISDAHPQLAHDYTAQRKLTLAHVFTPFGMGEDWVERAYAVYERERNVVECYPDAEIALAALAERLPLVAISNGNANLQRMALGRHFQFQIAAREFGRAKPDPSIFHHACERLGLQPAEVLHVGDDPVLDVEGARDAGLRTAWINRGPAPANSVRADIEIADLHALVEWLDRQAA